MKTKSILITLATIAFIANCHSQEISANFLNDVSIHKGDYSTDNSETPERINKRAAFNSSSNYGSLQEFISLHIQFPEDARTIGVTGAVIAQFEIQSDGFLGEIYFIKSPDPLFSEEVERVLRLMPKFIPAIEDGKFIPSFEQVKINFTLH